MALVIVDLKGNTIRPGDMVQIDTEILSYTCTIKEIYNNRLIATLHEFNDELSMFAYVCITSIEKLQISI